MDHYQAFANLITSWKLCEKPGQPQQAEHFCAQGPLHVLKIVWGLYLNLVLKIISGVPVKSTCLHLLGFTTDTFTS